MADPFANMPPEQIASIQYQLANADDDRSGVIYASTWALWFLAFVGILLRFYAKRIVNSGFLWEDGTILAAFLCATGLVINTTIGASHGGGRHLVTVSASDLDVSIRTIYSFYMIYTSSLTLTKFSILLFFHRTFAGHFNFKIAIYVMAALVGAWFTATMTASIFQCTPVSFYWDKTQTGTCIDGESLYFITAIINVIYDVIIVSMPMPVIWKLQMPRSRKIGISGIILLGAIVILASIVRLVYVKTLKTYDLLWDAVDIGIWSAVEPNVGVLGACLPVMTPLFKKIKEMSTKKSFGDSSDSGWNHTRLEENQAGAIPIQPQQQWSKKSMESGRMDSIRADNTPLVRHTEWVQEGTDSTPGQPPRTFEMHSIAKRPTSIDLALR